MAIPTWILVFAQSQEVPPPPAFDLQHAKAVVKELSWARTAPREYARFLRELRPLFEGNKLKLPNRPPLITEEGLPALDEAIRFLEQATPLGPLRWNDGLSKAAADHALDQSKTGAKGHLGSQGANLHQRLLRHGLPLSTFGEAIAYGKDDARLTAIQLLVDDGVKNRGHRRLIFNSDFHTAGASTAPHPEFEALTVIDFADAFTPN